jgi:hypothetical protein
MVRAELAVIVAFGAALACDRTEDAGPRDATENDASDAGFADASTEADAGAEDAAPAADAGSEPLALDLNDVSILVPLPRAGEPRAAFLWVTPRQGEVGPYFPAHRRDELPAPIGDLPLDPGEAEMVVGVRFDPCFRAVPGDPCEPQLRLVAQPVFYEGTADPSLTNDTALHLFYRLTEAEVADVLEALRAIKARSPVSTAGPLRVHPGLAEEGSEGSVGEAVRALVVAWCRADNLIRVTTNTFAFDNWMFSRFEWRNDHFEGQQLLRMTTPATVQAWLRQAFVDSLDDPAGTIDPAPVESFAYLRDRMSYATPDPIELERATALLSRIENPAVRLADEVDCVSCHVGAQLRVHAEAKGISFESAPDRYQPPPGVDVSLSRAPEMIGNLGVTIMFGHHHQVDGSVFPSISRRVIFETAEVVASLSR